MPKDSQTRIDSHPTVRTPLPSPPLDDRLTLMLREQIIDLRDTILVPPQAGPPVPPPQPMELVRFGPGVPAVLGAETALSAESTAPPPRSRRERVLNMALTLALAGVVAWLLWPAGPLHARAVSVRSSGAVVACNSSADVVATVRTNGNAGQLKYRWTRNDGRGSGTLVQSLSRGQHSVNLHLTWTFRGPGTYDARATVQLITPSTSSATVNFRYAC